MGLHDDDRGDYVGTIWVGLNPFGLKSFSAPNIEGYQNGTLILETTHMIGDSARVIWELHRNYWHYIGRMGLRGGSRLRMSGYSAEDHENPVTRMCILLIRKNLA